MPGVILGTLNNPWVQLPTQFTRYFPYRGPWVDVSDPLGFASFRYHYFPQLSSLHSGLRPQQELQCTLHNAAGSWDPYQRVAGNG
jgi:hypothetical protein